MRRRFTFFHREDSFDEASVNLTPLIDVVFVVLIIFILVAPMLEVDRVQLARTASTANQHEPNGKTNNIAIHVHSNNTIWLNGQSVPVGQLPPMLQLLRRTYPADIPQLFQDSRSCFGTYQSVKNAVEIAGFEELEVILQPG